MNFGSGVVARVLWDPEDLVLVLRRASEEETWRAGYSDAYSTTGGVVKVFAAYAFWVVIHLESGRSSVYVQEDLSAADDLA